MSSRAASRSSTSFIPGATCAERSSGHEPRVGLAGGDPHVVGALVDLRGRDPRGDEQVARDVGIGAAGDLDAAAALRVLHAVDDAQRLVDRGGVRVGGAQQQRSVDVEEQQHA